MPRIPHCRLFGTNSTGRQQECPQSTMPVYIVYSLKYSVAKNVFTLQGRHAALIKLKFDQEERTYSTLRVPTRT